MMKNNPDKITIVYAVNANIVPKGPIMLKQHYKVIFTLNMSKYYVMKFFFSFQDADVSKGTTDLVQTSRPENS